MEKSSRAIIGVFFLIVLIICGIGAYRSCVPAKPKMIELKGWTLAKLKDGTVNIVSADSEALVENGVLNIPAFIGKYKITGFGAPSYWSGIGMLGSQKGGLAFTMNEELKVERVVIAAELKVDDYFWGHFSVVRGFGGVFKLGHTPLYIEFLNSDLEEISFGGKYNEEDVIKFIVPDGALLNYVEAKRGKFEEEPAYRSPYYEEELARLNAWLDKFIEKSKFLEEQAAAEL